jgi:ribose transport system permease protein
MTDPARMSDIAAGPPREAGAAARPPRRIDPGARLLDHAPFLVACLMLIVIVGIYGSLQRGVFSLDELNLDTTATLTLLLAATGQTIVLLRGGIDLSIGGMVSFGTVLAATRFGDDPGSVIFWSVVILAIGFGVGAVNGLLISVLRLQPFLITLATWSILGGASLIVLPTDGGHVPAWWQEAGSTVLLGLATPVWLLILLLAFWFWFRQTRLGIAIKATGSNERSAFLSGVSLTRINLITYGLSGLFAAAAALYLTTQTGAGSPTIGKDYILPSVAAAVIGGVSLFGGRGSLAGTAIGAFILTIIGNLVFVLHISSYWQPVAQGVILLIAVLASSLAEKATRGQDQ